MVEFKNLSIGFKIQINIVNRSVGPCANKKRESLN